MAHKLQTLAFVFLFCIGFAIFEYGAVNAKNADTVLIKNIVIVAICCVSTYIVGYSAAYGEFFIRDDPNFLFSRFEDNANLNQDSMQEMLLQWVTLFLLCCMVTNLAVSGMVERTLLETQFLYAFIVSLIIFPFVYGWATSGFLAYLGISKYSGACYIHFLAGVCSFCGAYYARPRLGRYDPMIIRKVLDMDTIYLSSS
jgi:Amt family ammonium transporter